MKTVYKYPLDVRSQQTLSINAGAIVRGVGEQFGKVVIWAEVDPEAPMVQRTVLIYGTGHPMQPTSDNFEFLQTVITAGGALVWHVYLQDES